MQDKDNPHNVHFTETDLLSMILMADPDYEQEVEFQKQYTQFIGRRNVILKNDERNESDIIYTDLNGNIINK